MALDEGAVEGAAQVEQEEEQEQDLDFDAGFNGATAAADPTATPGEFLGGDEEPEEKADPVASTAEAPAAAAATGDEPAATPAAPAPKMVQVTEDELTQLRQQAATGADVRKELDKVFGKVGNLEQLVKTLRTETPAGEAITISDEDFADLAAEYPELAGHTKKALENVLKRVRGTGGMDPALVEQAVARVQTVSSEVTEAVLEGVIPGWREEVNTPAFGEWMKAQPADVQALAASDKLSDAARMLRLYDRHRNAPPPPPPPAPASSPAPSPAPVSPRQRQIAAAVTPRGDGRSTGPAPEEDEFETGFKTG